MNKSIGWMVLVGLMALPSAVRAHEKEGGAQDPVGVVEETPAGPKAGPVVEKAHQLKELKEKNPEEFRRAMEEKKAKLRERLEYLKKSDPEGYRKAMGKLRERRQKRLEWLKQNRPEDYQKAMEERRERLQKRLGELREKNPTKYEEILKRREAWRKENLGVRDHGQGEGRGGVGQGGEHRSPRSQGGIRGGGGRGGR